MCLLLTYDALEYISHRAWQDARLVLGPKHRKSLARGRLAIHKDAAVEAIQSLLYDWPRHLMIDHWSVNVGAKALIERERLRILQILIAPFQLSIPQSRIKRKLIRSDSILEEVLLVTVTLRESKRADLLTILTYLPGLVTLCWRENRAHPYAHFNVACEALALLSAFWGFVATPCAVAAFCRGCGWTLVEVHWTTVLEVAGMVTWRYGL